MRCIHLVGGSIPPVSSMNERLEQSVIVERSEVPSRFEGKVIVVVAGGFDPIHSGHLKHIEQAKYLGDYLIAITHKDSILEAKKNTFLLPVYDRLLALYHNKYVDLVTIAVDSDGTVAATLDFIRGLFPVNKIIFAKGGDRTENNMPKNEIKACKESNIEIKYGVGDLLGSSTNYLVDAAKRYYNNTGLHLDERN